MGKKINLIKTLSTTAKRDPVSVMANVYENTWQVYAKACDLKQVLTNSKIERIPMETAKGIGGNNTAITGDIDKGILIKTLWIHGFGMHIGEDFKLVGTTNIVAIT